MDKTKSSDGLNTGSIPVRGSSELDLSVYQLHPGVYVITSTNRYDLGNLFCCVQEFYESTSPQWHGQHFSREQYQRWYALNISEEAVFSYPADWCGFNVPSASITGYYDNNPYVTDNLYDNKMQAIHATLNSHCSAPYYLIGVVEDDVETLNHELAHGLYHTNAAYAAEMNAEIERIPTNVLSNICDILAEMGYGAHVHHDEIQANFATGLTNYFDGFEKYASPFEEVFRKYKRPTKLTPIG